MKIIMIVFVTMMGGTGEMTFSHTGWETVADCEKEIEGAVNIIIAGNYLETVEARCERIAK